jgi:hypothetical protein
MGIAAAGSASGSVVEFFGTEGDRSAFVRFEASGSMLTVRLSNSSLADVLVPVDILTAVFFDIRGDLIDFEGVAAVVADDSEVLFGPTDPGGGVGGEWAHAEGVNAPGDARYAISSSGMGLVGPHDRFPGSNLQGPESPGGLEYGLTSAGDDPETGNAPVTGDRALIQHEVIFTLSGLPDGFDVGRIENVSFQYGTSLSEPNIPGIPSPGSAAILVVGTALMLQARRERGRGEGVRLAPRAA